LAGSESPTVKASQQSVQRTAGSLRDSQALSNPRKNLAVKTDTNLYS